ncbi:MAG: hypothetical protein IJB74_07430 [Clostridia bacterium]|nr:hypothetical protein [Clostridia bacterium]
MKNKKWLRSVAFILLLAVAFVGVSQCYGIPNSYDTRNLAAFDDEKEGTIDGLVFGTSVIGYSWNTPAAWQDYGMAIYHMGTSEQPFAVIRPFMDYALKKHDIKYAVIDVHGLRSKTVISSLKATKVRSAYLNFPGEFSRFKVLHAIFDYAEMAFEFYGKPKDGKYVNLNDKSYYLPLYIFHSRWVDGLKKSDFVTVENKYMGANDRKNAFGVMDCSGYLNLWDYEITGEIDGFQRQQLEMLFEYGKEKNIELIFISLPSFRTKDEQRELSNLIKFCNEQGYDTIDFADETVLNEAGIDLKKDFVNKGHLNSRGGIKSTKYVCEFLKEKGYYTPDHRGEELYKSWNKSAKAYFNFYENGWKNKK